MTFLTPSEKHSIGLSASLSSHGSIIVINGRSLYEAVAVNKSIKKKRDLRLFAQVVFKTAIVVHQVVVLS